MLMAQDLVETGGAQFGALYLLARAASDSGRVDLLPELLKRADAVLEKSIETGPNQPEA